MSWKGLCCMNDWHESDSFGMIFYPYLCNVRIQQFLWEVLNKSWYFKFIEMFQMQENIKSYQDGKKFTMNANSNKFHSSFTFFVGKLLISSFPVKKSKVSSRSRVTSFLYLDLSLNKTQAAAWTGLRPLLSSSIMFSNTLSSAWMHYFTSFRLFMICLTWCFLSTYFGVSFNKSCFWVPVICREFKKSAVHERQFFPFSFSP